MQCRNSANLPAELKTVVDEILAAQQRESSNRKRQSSDAEACEDTKRDRSKQRKGDARRSRGVESSKRFSVRVMEAMRALERQKEAQSTDCAPVCSSVCEIVEYVAENFRTDGDLDAQVRTALKRTCCQGFVKYERNDAYRLVGPFVRQLMKTQQANSATSMSSLTARRSIHDAGEQNDSPCNRNSSGDSDQVQESSENELSIPTSVADDIMYNRIRRQENARQNNAGDRACGPQNPCASNQNRNQNPCASNQNRNQNPCPSNQNRNQNPCASNQNRNQNPCPGSQNRNQGACEGNQNRNQGACARPRSSEPNQSSATDQEEGAARILTPAGELEVTYSNGEDDDDDEDYEAGDDEAAGEEDEEEEEEGGAGDAASDDSALHEINMRNRRPANQARDQELKRWIRQCRKECERQAAQRGKRNR